jgi:hypothetical protein
MKAMQISLRITRAIPGIVNVHADLQESPTPPDTIPFATVRTVWSSILPFCFKSRIDLSCSPLCRFLATSTQRPVRLWQSPGTAACSRTIRIPISLAGTLDSFLRLLHSQPRSESYLRSSAGSPRPLMSPIEQNRYCALRLLVFAQKLSARHEFGESELESTPSPERSPGQFWMVRSRAIIRPKGT